MLDWKSEHGRHEISIRMRKPAKTLETCLKSLNTVFANFINLATLNVSGKHQKSSFFEKRFVFVSRNIGDFAQH